jgi:hypothetical protein
MSLQTPTTMSKMTYVSNIHQAIDNDKNNGVTTSIALRSPRTRKSIKTTDQRIQQIIRCKDKVSRQDGS